MKRRLHLLWNKSKFHIKGILLVTAVVSVLGILSAPSIPLLWILLGGLIVGIGIIGFSEI